ncbi:efflux RND transporter periplasmic adaptor subunit [Pseudoalteromonas sp. SSMSWG5]|uniref:efflux RND transporter periplasmic adaptor subunit n=1 Tax=Pseudoalteromonas sp. SSMSWG5 TaxID=3139396 RepID=UPI003BA97572
MKNITKGSMVLMTLMLASTLLGCDQKQPEENTPVSRPVKIYTVGGDSVQNSSRYPGSVSAALESTLAFEVPGKITSLKIKEGQTVSAGQVLANLDARDYQSQLDSTQSNRDAALADFERYKKALKANAVTPQAFDEAKRNLEVAQSEFRRAKKAVDDTTLTAPFAGRVVSINIDQFDTVHAKQPVLQLHSDSAFEMIVDVPEADWAQGKKVSSASEIDLKDQLFVTVSAAPNEKFPGVITEFSGAADAITRTYKVTVAFSVSEDSIVGSGMTGHVLYEPLESSSGNRGLQVPVDAIVGDVDNQSFVWLYNADKGIVTKQPVILGSVSSNWVQIESGLARGDQIAVSGVHSMFDGFLVHPLED